MRIFIALKYPSPWPGLNSRPLGRVASTLNTTPPRRSVSCLNVNTNMYLTIIIHVVLRGCGTLPVAGRLCVCVYIYIYIYIYFFFPPFI
jgi:hypothetical protein